MSVELRETKRRIGSTNHIRKVTSALQKVAAARLVRDRRAAEASQRYTLALRRLLKSVFMAEPDVTHPFTARARGTRGVLVIFGADRGLCGGFNAGLVDAMLEYLAETHGEAVGLIVVGAVVARRARHKGLRLDRVFDQPGRTGAGAADDTLETIASHVTGAFTEGTLCHVDVLYARFDSVLRQTPVVERLLPAQPGEWPREPHGVGILAATGFEPAPAPLVDALLPELVHRTLCNAFLNSLASENAARQASMSRASENAGQILDELRRTYSRLRQESITTEMIELAGGSVTRD